MNKTAKWIIGLLLLCLLIVAFWCQMLTERVNRLKDERRRAERRHMEPHGLAENYAVFVSLWTIASQGTVESRDGMFKVEMQTAASRICQVLMQLPDDSQDLKVLWAQYRAGEKPYATVTEHLEAMDREYGTDRAAKLRNKLSEPPAGGDGKPAPQP